MSDADNDRELRSRFVELRESIERETPPFGPPAAGPGRRPRVVHWRPAAAYAALAAAAGLLVLVGRGKAPEPEPPPYAGSTWRVPTDFLLDTPGRELLGVPEDLAVSGAGAGPSLGTEGGE